MKVIIAVIMVVEFVSAQVSASPGTPDYNPETCIPLLQELTRDYETPAGLEDFVTKMKGEVDLTKYMDSYRRGGMLANLKRVAIERPEAECEVSAKIFHQMDEKCDLWLHQVPRDILMEGNTGKFTRDLFACYAARPLYN